MRAWWKPEPFNYLFKSLITRSITHLGGGELLNWSLKSSHHPKPSSPFSPHTCHPQEATDSTQANTTKTKTLRSM